MPVNSEDDGSNGKMSGWALLNQDDMNNMSKNPTRFQSIVAKADENIHYKTSPVADFAPEPHYTASGINQTQNNGKNFTMDARMAYTQALAYLVTKDLKYAKAAQRIIDEWANVMQIISTRQGKATVNFDAPYLIVACSWVATVDNWNHTKADNMIKNILLPASERKVNGNHGLWGILMEATAAQYFQNGMALNSAYNRWQEILASLVIEDGTMPSEMERSGTTNWRGGPDKGKKGIAYTHYTLFPAALSAKIFSDSGLPVWNSSGGLLMQKAFAKAAEWTLDPTTFPYYQSNNGQLDEVNNAAYFTILNKYYPNTNAQAVIDRGALAFNGFNVLELFNY